MVAEMTARAIQNRRGLWTMAVAPPELRNDWARWCALIGDIAHGRPAWKRITPHQYAALHRSLTEGCARWRVEGDAELSAVAAEMERLAVPWMSLEILGHTDRMLLADLWRQVGAVRGAGIGRVLAVSSRRGRGWLRTAMVAVVLGGLVGMVWVWWSEGASLTSVSYDVKRTWWSLQRAVAGRDRATFYVVAVVLVTLFAGLLYTTRKS